MLYDFSKVIAIPGNPDEPLINWAKQACNVIHKEDPQNIEHMRKMQLGYLKLDRAVDGKVELKSSNAEWIRDRMIKFQFPPQVMFAMEEAINGELKQSSIDEF